MEGDFLFNNVIEKFLEYIAVEKRFSANTVTSYRKDLSDFSEYLLRAEGQQDHAKADKKIIRNFIYDLSEKGISKRSINRKLSVMRSFYHFLLKIGEIPVSPMQGISSLKFYPEKQIPFSREEMANLRDQVFADEKVPVLHRHIIETLYQTGMRKSELCGLLLEDADLSNFTIRVVGKGNKARLIPISEALAAELNAYLHIRKPQLSAEKYFFVNGTGKKLTQKFVYETVIHYLGLVTSKSKRSPHILRHSFASHVLESGAEITKVKKILGHASLASTQVYTSANIDQLKKVLDNAHPRANKE